MRLLLALLQPRVYVKPMDISAYPLWGGFRMSILESSFDDWVRYGRNVAWANFQLEWTLLYAD